MAEPPAPSAQPRPAAAADWPDRIHAVFSRNGIAQVGYVPDTGHARLISLCQEDNAIIDVVLASEAEVPGLVLGAALAGRRAVRSMSVLGE